jgi:transcriptional regulator with GAF, ATPase, and Fis domain
MECTVGLPPDVISYVDHRWGQAPARADDEQQAHTAAVADKLNREVALAKLIGQHPAFLAVVHKIPLVASAPSPALILGETGTGKELCARAIHHLSRRRHAPFIPVDCGALPDYLLENELFGHVRGAFTDAHRDQRGLVAMAEGGTLFLDEVDSLAPTAQGKLLRLLQEGTYKPLGADRFLSADVRIVAATNCDLEHLVAARRLRSDLYFRLNVLRLVMPPLRERRSDIPQLAHHFVQQACVEAGVPRKLLAPDALDKLVQAPWPGNVRELLNVIQRAVVFAEGATIQSQHVTMADPPALLPPASTSPTQVASEPQSSGSLPPEASASAPTEAPAETPGAAVHDGSFRAARARALEAFERTYVETLLHKHNGNVTHSAREAKKDRRAFGRLMKRYQIDRRTR